LTLVALKNSIITFPLLVDGIETDVDHQFLDHYVSEFSRVLTLINDDSNPFQKVLVD
jgi:hypothetical protein